MEYESGKKEVERIFLNKWSGSKEVSDIVGCPKTEVSQVVYKKKKGIWSERINKTILDRKN